jgi:hypothetical protein
MSQKVYATIRQRARDLAAAGLDVVVDASFAKQAEREELLQVAQSVNANLTFVLVQADQEVVLERLAERESRGQSMSDGRREIYRAQSEAYEPFADLEGASVVFLDASGEMEETEQALWSKLKPLFPVAASW